MKLKSCGSTVRCLFAGIGAATLVLAPAEARRVAVDDPWESPSAGFCTLGGFDDVDCKPVALQFTVTNFDTAFTSVYLYDDGLLTFGAKVTNPAGADFGPPGIVANLSRIIEDETLPGFPLTPVFVRVLENSSSQFKVEWYRTETLFNCDGYSGPSPEPCSQPTEDDPFALVPGSFASLVDAELYQSLVLRPLADGRTAVEFYDLPTSPYSYPDGLEDVVFEEPDPNIDGKYFWYSFGTRSVVPEPASWALMISGFGLVGAALRRRTSATA